MWTFSIRFRALNGSCSQSFHAKRWCPKNAIQDAISWMLDEMQSRVDQPLYFEGTLFQDGSVADVEEQEESRPTRTIQN